jgi:very-short-patch-repair endonuclease
MTHERVAAMLELAGRQHGLVRLDQLADLGIDRSALSRLTRSGIVEPIGGRGIRRVAGGAPTPHQRLLASVWAAGDGAVASHRAAAWLWAIDGFERLTVEVSTPRSGGRCTTSVHLHHSTDLFPAFVTTVDGIPITEPTRTLIDLAAVVDLDALECAFDSALRQGLTSLARAEVVLRRMARRGRDGVGRFRRMFEARLELDGVPDSTFETRLVQVLRRAGLPEPVRQVRLYDGDGFIGRFDTAYPDAMVLIEADSVRHHHDRARFERDRERRSRAEAIGWRVPTFTWRHVTRRPGWVAGRVEAILEIAGWDWRNAA